MGKAENLAGQRRIGFVLYPISANISYGKGDASETNIAAKLSNAHGFIRGHQQGYYTVGGCKSSIIRWAKEE
ncbi:hypothetical protein DY000_02031194 [Brassica cretica]|uniref:Uncharacterized protein n=1 Tax=Brassica cretica TaxID=69181 RepID=A0ABQ7DFV6_BRACR|nr:hypothetical protein DY000_02031194 [Brassica cretica]